MNAYLTFKRRMAFIAYLKTRGWTAIQIHDLNKARQNEGYPLLWEF